MEVVGIKNIFYRSKRNYSVRYTNYIGDGNTATFRAVKESEPYRPDVPIEKEECV